MSSVAHHILPLIDNLRTWARRHYVHEQSIIRSVLQESRRDIWTDHSTGCIRSFAQLLLRSSQLSRVSRYARTRLRSIDLFDAHRTKIGNCSWIPSSRDCNHREGKVFRSRKWLQMLSRKRGSEGETHQRKLKRSTCSCGHHPADT